MPHIHEKIDFTVEVLVVHKDKVLLRFHDKYKYWCSIGGHIELDEDPIQAAVREVKEEVGLDIEIVGDALPNSNPGESWFHPLIPPRYLCKHNASPTHDHITFVYFAKTDNPNVVESQSEHERAETRWFAMEDLETVDLVPNIKFYAQEALKALAE